VGVGPGLYMYDVDVKRSRSLSLVSLDGRRFVVVDVQLCLLAARWHYHRILNLKKRSIWVFHPSEATRCAIQDEIWCTYYTQYRFTSHTKFHPDSWREVVVGAPQKFKIWLNDAPINVKFDTPKVHCRMPTCPDRWRGAHIF